MQAHYSTGAVAAGFTSTVMPVETIHQAAVITEDLVRYERVKKKGRYVITLLLQWVYFFFQETSRIGMHNKTYLFHSNLC